MTQLSVEEQIRIIHAVNQAAIDGKTVIVGALRVYGAICYNGKLYFLFAKKYPKNHRLFGFPPPLKTGHVTIDKVVIRAFSSNSTDVDIIYTPPVTDSTAAENPDLSNPSP